MCYLFSGTTGLLYANSINSYLYTASPACVVTPPVVTPPVVTPPVVTPPAVVVECPHIDTQAGGF